MNCNRSRCRAAIGLASALVAGAAFAAPPANDTWTGRTTIASLPFAETMSIVEATSDGDEPLLPCFPFPDDLTQTVWYRYVTGSAAEYLRLSTVGSNYDSAVAVMRGVPGAFELVPEGCNDDGAATFSLQSLVAGVRLDPNTEYSILVSRYPSSSAPPSLNLTVTAAPVYQVTKTEDTLDGACDADCSLREAVSANNDAPGVVLIPPGSYVLTRAGSGEDTNETGDLDLRQAGAFYGAGVDLTIVDAAGLDRVLDLRGPLNVWETLGFTDLTLARGAVVGNGGGVLGVASAFVSFNRVRIVDSSATIGGGLYLPSATQIRDSELLRNSATDGGGGLGGGNTLWFRAENTTFAGNTAVQGGAMRVSYVQLVNVTLSGNSASQGGAVYSNGALILASGLTAVANQAPSGGGAVFYLTGLTEVELNNSLLDLNDGGSTGVCVAPFLGSFLDGDYNLLQDWPAGDCVFRPGKIGNLSGLDARVSPVLARNGGLTLTHALLPRSPAIDSGSPGCADFLGVGTLSNEILVKDQRRRSRLTDGDGDGVATCDRGAYERTRVKGDFDSDRSTDLLLHSLSTNAHVAWLMNGTARAAEAAVTPDPPGATWRVAGVDDFTGDDIDDLVLHDSASGAVEFWRMGGASGSERQGDPIAITNAPALDSSWILAATADFDRDARPDLVWRNDVTQKIAIWPMAGTERTGVIVPVPDQAVDANWAIVAALDWDGNGTTDFLWYNSTTGKIVQWLMDDAVVRTAGRFTTPPNAGDNNWKVVAGGDYGIGPSGQPGTADVVWRNATSGRLVVWHMGWDGVRTAGLFTTPDAPDVPLDWDVVGPR